MFLLCVEKPISVLECTLLLYYNIIIMLHLLLLYQMSTCVLRLMHAWRPGSTVPVERMFINLKIARNIGNDHTNMTAPLPVCSACLGLVSTTVLLSEVKHVRAWVVLWSGTTLESQVLFSFCQTLFFLFFFQNK